MLQQDSPEVFVLATGEVHSVREFIFEAAQELGIKIQWEGQGISEKGIDAKSGQVLVSIDKRFFRPAEVDLLMGDASLAREKLGWQPKTNFKTLVKIMVQADLEAENNKK
jgi:GDPmannose 4,6-dehydratase